MASMNKLTTAKRAEVIGLLCEGMSMRAICRTTGVARQTISDLVDMDGDRRRHKIGPFVAGGRAHNFRRLGVSLRSKEPFEGHPNSTDD